MIDGMRTGFLLYPNSTDRILPITHINLVIDDDGRSMGSTLKKWQAIIDSLGASTGNGGGVLSVNTLADLQVLDTQNLKYGAICYVIEIDTYYRYAADGWQILSTSGGNTELPPAPEEPDEDIYSHIWIGPDPPVDDNMLWLDTNEDGIIEGEDDILLLYALRDKMNELQTEVEVLKGRVKYLEDHGVVVDPNPGPGPDTDEDDLILLEDGSEILLENGLNLLLEIQEVDPEPTTNNLLFEDGIEILLEDGSLLLLEDGSTMNPIEDSITANYEATIETLSLSSESSLQVNDKSLAINSNKASVLNNNLIL